MFCKHKVIGSSPVISITLINLACLVKLVDTSDLKSDSIVEYWFKSDNKYIYFKKFNARMMELVDMLGLGSSSFRVGVQVPFLVLL